MSFWSITTSSMWSWATQKSGLVPRFQGCGGRPSWGRDIWVPEDDPNEFTISERLQPLFKLHGSSNWRDAEGGELLVVGGNKARAIDSIPVLKWYSGKFQEDIESGARLFVIGYSFKDNHINKAIIDGVRDSGLKFFVVDPLGSEVARRANPSHGGMIYSPNELDDTFTQGLMGASRRSLRDTFGGDPISHGNVMRFFE